MSEFTFKTVDRKKSTEECLYCEQRFCSKHVNQCEGCNIGPSCSACADKHGWKQGIVCSDCLDEPEPECNCTRVDVDLYDPRGCEFHDDDSDWNRRQKRIDRALEAA